MGQSLVWSAAFGSLAASLASAQDSPIAVAHAQRRAIVASSPVSPDRHLKDEHALVDGEGRIVIIPPGPIRPFEDQYVIDVPDGSESLLVELIAADITHDFDVYVRRDLPVEFIGDTGVAADAWSSSGLGYEEVGLWAWLIGAGRYYVAIDIYCEEGGDLTLRATIDTAIVTIASGVEADVTIPADISAPGDLIIVPDGHQYRCTVPESAQAVYVRFQSDNPAANPGMALRFQGPSYRDRITGRLQTGQAFLFGGKCEEACLSGADVLGGADLYVWLFHDNGLDELVTGKLLIVADGCYLPLAAGETIDGLAPASYWGDGALSARQFAFSVREPRPQPTLRLEVTGDGADLDLFVRRDSPVAVEGEGIVADFHATTAGIDPEELTLPCSDLTVGEYYVAVFNPSYASVPYALTLQTGPPCPPRVERFRRADMNTDSRVNIADVVCALVYLFGPAGAPCKQSVAQCLDAADTNDDGRVNISDPIMLLRHLFGGEALPAPFAACGADETADGLGCASFGACD